MNKNYIEVLLILQLIFVEQNSIGNYMSDE